MRAYSQYPATQITDQPNALRARAPAVETCVAYLGQLQSTSWTLLKSNKPNAPPAGLVLTYGSGQDGKSTVITFQCDPTQTSITIPTFLGAKGTVYQFSWVSAAACPLK